jgi:CheY-like chemotaxis protein
MEPRTPTVLIVDDEPQVLQFLTIVLRLAGYGVQTASSGATALAMIADQPPDLLVLDLVMPEPDGFEVLQAIRDHNAELPVLVTSGFHAGTLLHAASLLGATAVLEKPVAPASLLEAVRDLCGLPVLGAMG